MGDDITIGVTEIVNNIEVTAQTSDQVIEIDVVDNSDDVTLNITPTVIEININKGSSFARWGTILGNLPDQADLQNVLNLKADLVGGLVPASQLPSYVDDIVEVANYAALPVVGETGKIYLTLDNNKIFRWSGSVYIEVAANNAIWGAITGTLSSQTDLQTALDTKALKTITITPNAPLSGGGDLSANRTISISQSNATTDGYLSSTDWITFNGKADDALVVHKAGSETITGIKTFTGSSTIFDYTGASRLVFKADGTDTAEFSFGSTFTQITSKASDGYLFKNSAGSNSLTISNAGAGTFLSSLTATSFIKTGGTSSQFLKADGSIDSNVYALDSVVVKLTGDQAIAGIKTFSSDVKSTAFRLTGGTAGTGLYYGHTNKVVLANYTIGGGIDFETNGGEINMTLNELGNLFVRHNLITGNASDTVNNLFRIDTNKAIFQIEADGATSGAGTKIKYTYGSGSQGSLRFVRALDEDTMILAANGNVGIGTPSTPVKLVVDGGSSDYTPIWAKSSFLASSKYYASLYTGYALTSNQSCQFGYVYDTVTPTNSFAHITPYGSSEGSKFMVRADGNVGIGTPSPSAKLEVSGGNIHSYYTYVGNGENYNIRLKNDLSGDNGYLAQLGGTTSLLNNAYYASAGQYKATSTTSSSIALESGNVIFNAQSGLTSGSNFSLSERMRISSNGRVGINETNPNARLHISEAITYGIYGPDKASIIAGNTTTDGKAGFISLVGHSGNASTPYGWGGIGGGKMTAVGNGEYGGYLSLWTTSNGENGQTASASYERMRITSGGNVGIGTTSPGVRFVNAGGTNSEGPTFGSGTVGANAILSANGLYGLYTGVSNSGHVWQQVQRNDGSTAVYPLSLQPSGGTVCIGTVTAFDSGLVCSDGGTTYVPYTAKIGTTASSTQMFFRNPNGVVGSISTSGSATSYNTSSDYRLKQDLKPINGLDLVSQIKVYDYQWKSDETRAYGVLAHELQEVIPQAVNGEKDGEKMQGVDYSKLVPILVQAIQELQEKINKLENK